MYTIDCPNLNRDDGITLDIDTPLSQVGGRGCSVGKEGSLGTGLPYCAHLCYSHELYGVPVVPVSIWQSAQTAEGAIWASSNGDGDRYEDHWQGFQDFRMFSANELLGSVAEFGSGPWTQFPRHFCTSALT